MRWKPTAIVFIAASLVVDCWPHFGPPAFRYTGSDPSKHVWNIGWPLEIAILDQNGRLQVGPFAYVLLPFEVIVLAVAAIAATITVRNRRSRASGSQVWTN